MQQNVIDHVPNDDEGCWLCIKLFGSLSACEAVRRSESLSYRALSAMSVTFKIPSRRDIENAYIFVLFLTPQYYRQPNRRLGCLYSSVAWGMIHRQFWASSFSRKTDMLMQFAMSMVEIWKYSRGWLPVYEGLGHCSWRKRWKWECCFKTEKLYLHQFDSFL